LIQPAAQLSVDHLIGHLGGHPPGALPLAQQPHHVQDEQHPDPIGGRPCGVLQSGKRRPRVIGGLEQLVVCSCGNSQQHRVGAQIRSRLLQEVGERGA
jgi:hypothetical protein